MLLTTIRCDHCGNPFDRLATEIRRSQREGRGQYCSRTCSGSARSARPRIIHEPNETCAYCNKTFYIKPSSRANARHGFFFCCREHKDLAQRIGGIKAIQPSHYGSSLQGNAATYRRIAFEHYERKCYDCGWSAIPEVIEVHHLDCNRGNNTQENLLPLCPTCHDVRHFQAGTGKWSRGESTS